MKSKKKKELTTKVPKSPVLKGDKIFVFSDNLVEISNVEEVNENIILSNGIILDFNLIPKNSKKVKIELFDPDKEEEIIALMRLPKLLQTLDELWRNKKLKSEQVIKLYKKLNKVLCIF